MKVLVSGATGYIGAYVTRALLAGGHRVTDLAGSGRRGAQLRALGAEAASGDRITVRQIAEAVAKAAGIPGKTESWPIEEARQELVAAADTLAIDQKVTAEKAQRELGWIPRQKELLDENASGGYNSAA